MAYIYYTTVRPAVPGAIPADGLESIENFDTRRDVGRCQAWARVTYNRHLGPQELSSYEISDKLPVYGAVSIPDLRDLSIACLKNPKSKKAEEAYIIAYGQKMAIYKRLFRDLVPEK